MIAVDAMGGDFAPQEIVKGALGAARRGISIGLFGDQVQIIAVLDHLDRTWTALPIAVYHCSQTIDMADEPGRSVIKRKDSSLVRAIQAVAQGQAGAVVSAGNSGAALVAGMIFLGKLPGVLRPAIGGFLPTLKDSVFCIDLGANVDSKPEYLQQFALMGDAYVRVCKHLDSPRVGLLANGTELGKGNKLVQSTYDLLQQLPLDFVGNCEPHDVLSGKADVIVCEGFSGNIMLKAMEATAQVIMQWLKNEGSRSLLGKCVGLLGAPIFKRLKKHLKKAERGGALLLGVTKPLVIAHGASNAAAIENAIVFAQEVVQQKLYEQFKDLLTKSLHVNSYVYSEQNAQQSVHLRI